MAVREKSAVSSSNLSCPSSAHRRGKRAAILAALAVTGSIGAATVHADTLWIPAAGNPQDYNNNANWTAGVSNGSGGFNSVVNNGGTVLIQPGDPTFNSWDINSDNGTYIQTGSTATANGWFRLGISSTAGNTNLYDISGTGSVFNAYGQAHIGEVNGATATLNVSSSAVFNYYGTGTGYGFSAATNGGATGYINVFNNGNIFDLAPNDNAPLAISNGGTAVLNISSGNVSSGTNEMWIGQVGTGTVNQTGGTITVGNWLVLGRNGGNGTWNMSGGVLNDNAGGGGNFEIGEDATDVFNLSGTAVVNSTSQIWIAQNGGTNGTWNMTGGTLNVHNWLAVSRNGGTGFLDISGGVINQDSNGSITTGGTGLITQTGGAINTSASGGGNNAIWIGEQGTSGTWNMSGGTASTGTLNIGQGVTGTVNLTPNTGTGAAPAITATTLNIANNSNGTLNLSGGSITTTDTNVAVSNGSTGTLNLNTGGTLITNDISKGGPGAAAINLNGGTLRAPSTGTDLIHGFTGTQVTLGAGTSTQIDTQTFSTTISSPLTGTGGFTKVGTGTLSLGGSSSYSGVTTVKAGILKVGVVTYYNNIQDTHVAAYYPFSTATTSTVQGALQFNDVSLNGAGVANANNLFSAQGTATISTTSSPTNQSGGSLQLGPGNAGVKDYLTTPGQGTPFTVGPNETTLGTAPTNFPIGNSSYTFAAWINVDGTNATSNSAGNGNTIIGYGNFGQSHQTNFFRTGDDGSGMNTQNALNNSWFNDDANGNILTGQTPVIGNWNYVAVTYNAVTNVRTMYYDGQVIETDNPGQNNAAGTNFAVGSDPSFSYLFSGNMADLLVTSDALTPAQLATAASSTGVTFGTVTNSSGGVLSATSPIAIASGATVDLNGTSQIIAGLQDSGSAPGGLLTSSTAGAGTSTLTLLTTAANSFSGNISNGSTILKLAVTGTGTQTLSGTNTYTGGTVVGTGTDTPTLTIATKSAFPTASALTVNSGVAQLAPHTGGYANALVLAPSSLTIGGSSGAWTGKVDITNNDLDLPGASLSTVTNQIASGFAGGLWTGNGITSSTAAASSSHLTAVGVATGLTSVDGVAVSATDVIVKYTYYGDANLDGAVDGSDYTKIDYAFMHPGTVSGWQNGDFNYDGKIDGSDYTLIDNAFNTQGGSLGTNPASLIASSTAQFGSSSVPEPASLGLIGIGAAGLLGRRRRK